ncbi:MAG: hypothetical protein GY854_13145 [Deltaproteobacteria bacterium]|nr:hypothetical protein [Deltaproteobacteria bacterium]
MTSGVHHIDSRDSIVVMYSGGLDSTLSAVKAADRFKRVILMTCDFKLTVGLNNSRRNVEKLRRRFPKRTIEHRIVDGNPARRRLWASFLGDYAKYCDSRVPSVLCFGCELSMLVEAMKICLVERVGHITNGASSSQADHTVCKPNIVNRFADFMAEYGITYVNDIYYMKTRLEEEEALASQGITMGVRVGASSVTHQPRCFIGPPTTLWAARHPVKAKQMERYFDDKKELLREILEPYASLAKDLESRRETGFRADPYFKYQHTHEFGPHIDRMLAGALTPLWWLSRCAFHLGRRTEKWRG